MITHGKHTIVPQDIVCHDEVILKFGSFCSIASGLKIISGQHPQVQFPSATSNFPFQEHGWGEYRPCYNEGVVGIGNDVWIGEDVTIVAGQNPIIISDGCDIASNSVIANSFVLPFRLIAGNPAQYKREKFDAQTRNKLLLMKWWNWPDDKIKKNLPYMKDARAFTSLC